jgi:hypothetical protein
MNLNPPSTLLFSLEGTTGQGCASKFPWIQEAICVHLINHHPISRHTKEQQVLKKEPRTMVAETQPWQDVVPGGLRLDTDLEVIHVHLA